MAKNRSFTHFPFCIDLIVPDQMQAKEIYSTPSFGYGMATLFPMAMSQGWVGLTMELNQKRAKARHWKKAMKQVKQDLTAKGWEFIVS